MKKNSLIIIILWAFSQAIIYAQTNRNIAVDLKNVKGDLSLSWRKCIGAGRANEGLRADWQEQLRMTKLECGFDYIRMHGLLHDDMGVYKEDKQGKPIYNFQYIDALYDFLLSIHVKPFVELAFMPTDLADKNHSGNEQVFWWKGNVKPPKSYEKWGNLITALVKHFEQRYGKSEVASWYFEVWNEPNLEYFWAGSQDEYFKLYETSARAIKEVNPAYRVGGPATAGNGWIDEFIVFCNKNKVPVDFISTHDYGVNSGFFDNDGQQGTILDTACNAVRRNMVKSKEKINKSPLPKLELHYTEWSSSYTPTDYIHDTYQEASYILDKIKGAGHAVNSMSYWVFTDIFEENGPRMTPFHGGFGLLNYQSIKKPAYYAYAFLNQLGPTELQDKDAASIITKDEKGNVQALLWDFTIIPNPDSMNNQVFYKKERPAKTKGTINLAFASLKPGAYLLEVSKTGYRSNDAYTSYLDFGSPSQLTREQVSAIKSINSGEPFEKKIITIGYGGTFEMNLSINENDVYLVKLIQ